MPPVARPSLGAEPAGELAAALAALNSLDAGGLLGRAEVSALVAEAVLATHRRLGGDDPAVWAHVDLERAGFELRRPGPDGEVLRVDPGHSARARPSGVG